MVSFFVGDPFTGLYIDPEFSQQSVERAGRGEENCFALVQVGLETCGEDSGCKYRARIRHKAGYCPIMGGLVVEVFGEGLGAGGGFSGAFHDRHKPLILPSNCG